MLIDGEGKGIIAKCDYLEEGIGVDSEFFLGMDS